MEKIWNRQSRARFALDKIQQKLKLLKHYFKGWDFNLWGELRKKKAIVKELATLESIEESGYLSSDQCVRKAWLIIENLNVLNQKELYWLNRCHENWLLKGDLNTLLCTQMTFFF